MTREDGDLFQDHLPITLDPNRRPPVGLNGQVVVLLTIDRLALLRTCIDVAR
jgi:hypothetical protein